MDLKDKEIDHLKFELSQAVSRELLEAKETEIHTLRKTVKRNILTGKEVLE